MPLPEVFCHTYRDTWFEVGDVVSQVMYGDVVAGEYRHVHRDGEPPETFSTEFVVLDQAALLALADESAV